ncbi:MAG: hypothetical protein PHD97_07185 [Bacteroidales bacterium]|nr:hypothetical protein [Bacteroidales bacterium]
MKKIMVSTKSIRYALTALLFLLVTRYGNVCAQVLGPAAKVYKYHFCFQPPKNWKSTEETIPKWISPDKVDGIQPNLKAEVTPALPGDFYSNVAYIVDQINKGGNGLKILDMAKVIINGRKAEFLYGQIPGNGFMYRVLMVIFDGTKEYVTITYIITANKWNEFKPLYEASAKTVKFQ